jgi:hypothetical protein
VSKQHLEAGDVDEAEEVLDVVFPSGDKAAEVMHTCSMVERWVASAWLLTETHFRKVCGRRDLSALAVALGREKASCNSEKVA